MSKDFRHISDGLNIVPKTASTAAEKGDLDVTSGTGVLNYHNGSSASQVVTAAHSATLTNKTIDADNNTISNIENGNIKADAGIDATKIADGSVTNTEFQYVSGVTSDIQTQIDSKASTTALNTHISDTTTHGTTGDIVGTSDTQTLTNKSLEDFSTSIVNSSDATKKIQFIASGTTGTTTYLSSSQTANRTLTLPDATTTLVGRNTTDSLSNKKLLTGSSTFADTSDVTKQLSFDLASLPTATSVNILLNPGSTTNRFDLAGTSNTVESIATLTGSQTFTNKTISGSSNTISNIANSSLATMVTGTVKGNISGSTATPSDIPLTSSNTNSSVVLRDGSGNFSAGTITATLTGNATNVSGTVAIANGGTGQTSKAAGFDALSPMTTSGDIIYGGASGTGTRLGKGSDGQILTLASGLPSWATASTGALAGAVVTASSTNAVWNFAGNYPQDAAADSDFNTPTVYGSASAPATKIPAITFTSLAAGTYFFVAWGAFENTQVTNRNFAYSFYDGTTTFGFTGQQQNDTTVGYQSGPLIGIVSYGSTQTNITIKIRGGDISGGGGTCSIRNTSSPQQFGIAVIKVL